MLPFRKVDKQLLDVRKGDELNVIDVCYQDNSITIFNVVVKEIYIDRGMGDEIQVVIDSESYKGTVFEKSYDLTRFLVNLNKDPLYTILRYGYHSLHVTSSTLFCIKNVLLTPLYTMKMILLPDVIEQIREENAIDYIQIHNSTREALNEMTSALMCDIDAELIQSIQNLRMIIKKVFSHVLISVYRKKWRNSI